MPREHVLGHDVVHHIWDSSLEPILEVESGDSVAFDIMVAGKGQVWPGATYADCRFDLDTIYNLTGPLLIVGAEPGDTLQVDIQELQHGDWGWSAIMPGVGLLADEFEQGYVKTFSLAKGEPIEIVPGVVAPVREFLGTIGTHPGDPAQCVPFPPHRGGGNIDNRHLSAGSTLWLPIHVPGGLFSCGDPHALQGDGEVCVTALEGPLEGTLKFTLHKKSIPGPAFDVHEAGVSRFDDRGYHGTMGIAPDLMEASRIAVRNMIVWLQDRLGVSREDAYVVCSLVGDLRIIEIVDGGMWTVAMTMPLSVLV